MQVYVLFVQLPRDVKREQSDLLVVLQKIWEGLRSALVTSGVPFAMMDLTPMRPKLFASSLATQTTNSRL